MMHGAEGAQRAAGACALVVARNERGQRRGKSHELANQPADGNERGESAAPGHFVTARVALRLAMMSTT